MTRGKKGKQSNIAECISLKTADIRYPDIEGKYFNYEISKISGKDLEEVIYFLFNIPSS